MQKLYPLICVILLAACTTAEEKMQSPLQKFDKYLLKKAGVDPASHRKIDSIAMFIDSIPDTLIHPLHKFAVKYPQNPASEKYLYVAILKSEKLGHFFDVAKFSEDFIKTFPKSNAYLDMLQKAAIRFEDVADYDKAILYNDRIAREFPGTPAGKGAANMAEMLRKGFITDEQKIEYIMKQNDSTTKK